MQLLEQIKNDIKASQFPVYVYILHKPDGTPFYVGKGGHKRIGHHEREAKSEKRWKGQNTFKLNTIKKIWASGQQVLYSIDSWHSDAVAANNREVELIEFYGRRILGKGPLTNITAGGEGAIDLPQEIREKLSASLKQYYIDHPEALEAMSERMKQWHIDNPEFLKQYYLDHPEAREHLSIKLKTFCEDYPEFIENLQDAKDDWIENNPEAYREVERRRIEICQTVEHRAKVSGIMKEYFQNNPEAADRLREQGAAYFENNPEAIEQARQNSLDNNTSQYIIEWLTSDDPVIVAERENKWREHSKWLKDWHQTEEGKKKTKQAAIKRNEKVRTESHRKHMAKKTAEFIKNNPEADKLRRAKVAATKLKKIEERQKVLQKIQEELFAAGKIPKKYDFVDSKIVYVWRKRGLIPNE